MPKGNRVVAIADACRRLFEKGDKDPSIERITDEYYGDVVWGDGEKKIIQDYLSSVAKVLVHAGYTVHLVSKGYYELGRRRGLEIAPEYLRQCLPHGTGRRSVGIRYVVRRDDPLYLEALSLNIGTAAGQIKRVATLQAEALTAGLISPPVALDQQRVLIAGSMPDRVELRSAMAALGDGVAA